MSHYLFRMIPAAADCTPRVLNLYSIQKLVPARQNGWLGFVRGRAINWAQ